MENRVSRSRFIPQAEEDTVIPNRWQGESDCLVGPFSSKRVAEYFAAQIVNSYETGPRAGEIEVVRDEWFLRINA